MQSGPLCGLKVLHSDTHIDACTEGWSEILKPQLPSCCNLAPVSWHRTSTAKTSHAAACVLQHASRAPAVPRLQPIFKADSTEVAVPCSVPEEAPAEVREVVHHCLQLDPATRPTAMQVRTRPSMQLTAP